tara:strand:- start:5923 stop:6486 length:564 start_codon:yes stop_codon:yes gene_type:complete
MESIIFDYIGYVLISCAAFCVVAPLLVYVISLALGVAWKVIDEGDSESPDLLKRVAPFLYRSGKIIKNDEGFAIVNRMGQFYDPSDKKFWPTDYARIRTAKNAESILESIQADADADMLLTLIVAAYLLALGLGFMLIPTITMYALSSALCLLSLRWSRRGYKKVKKLKIALDEHAKDKDAHAKESE